MTSSRGKQSKKAKLTEDPIDLKAFNFGKEEAKKGMSGSEDDIREGKCMFNVW